MLDLTNPRASLVAAALRVSERLGWRGAGLLEIADEAGVSLAQMRAEFQSKGQILSAFTRLIDDAVTAKLKPAASGESPRDRLFDVIMTRFEAMASYKAAIRRIADDLRSSPGEALAQLGPLMASQYWMLAGAGVTASGLRGAVKVKAMTALYARVFSVWLRDDDPGLARTMAALDRRLRQAEDAAKRVDGILGAGGRFIDGLRARRQPPPAPFSPEADAPSPQPGL